MSLQAACVRFQRAAKRWRRSHRGSLVVVALVALSLLWGLGLRSFLVRPTSFFRAPAEAQPLPPPTSVLHPTTPVQAPLNADVPFSSKTSTSGSFSEYSASFPQYGKAEPGQFYRVENARLLARPAAQGEGSLLLVTVFNDAESWGTNRSAVDYFKLVSSLDYPKEKISIALLTSSPEEFTKVKAVFSRQIHEYARLSVILRNDFSQQGLTRLNRHSEKLQSNRRRMLARYRNYALLSNLQSWHQHVLWLDADIVSIPSGLLLKMVESGLDAVTPLCLRRYSAQTSVTYDYDLNAWVGHRKIRSPHEEDFVPGPLNVRNMRDLQRERQDVVPLDSVGGTMLYVRADVHRQGAIFPAHYVIGSEWGAEGYDGIETEGFCYSAHFLGFKCWGMPKEIIHHAL